MKKRLLSAAFFVSAWSAYSQVGIGTLTPDPSSQLDIVSHNKGVLLPRISLNSTTDTTTITQGNVNSLLVFNINTQNDITPGYYYWYENKWRRVVNADDISALDKNTTNVSFAVENSNLILTDSEGNEVSIPLSQINIPSTLVSHNNGTYTYTSEDGTVTTINVPADVINQFEEIITNETVQNEIINLIQNIGGNVSYDGDQFTYVDNNGTTQVINIEQLVKANETVTTLVSHNNGTYTYTSEDGTVTTINVPADVINQFEEIITNETVQNEIINLIRNIGGNVSYDGDQFTYVDNNGTTQVINIEQLVKANETVTTLVSHNNGTYTYTSEDGTVTTINVPADVINQFEEIITNETVQNEIINLIRNIGGNVSYDGNEFTYVDNNGTTQVINIEQLVKANETVTTLVSHNNGTYTYTSEDGTVTAINVPADVINQFEEIITNETVQNEIINLIRNIGGNVSYDGDQFTYVDNNGTTQVINIEQLVKANETVTTLVSHNNGTYTYTSEDGTVTTINVPADVINQFEEIITNETVQNEIINLIQNVGGNVSYDGDQFTYVDNNGTTQVINIEQLVKANETVTTLVSHNNGTYTYTSEDGTVTTINVPADVINQFEEIITNETVQNEIINLIRNIGGNVSYDGDQFTYVDNNGTTQVINIEQLVKANETVTTLVSHNNGTYTYLYLRRRYGDHDQCACRCDQPV